MAYTLPNPLELASLFAELFDRKVTAHATTLAKPAVANFAIAEFHDSADVVRVVACCDGPLGASFGAALTMMPPDLVGEWLKSTTRDTTMSENLYETFNVLSSIFPRLGNPRMVLRNVSHDGKATTAAEAILARPGRKAAYDIDVGGYRAGKFGLYAEA